jgi:hypothetical protein
VSFLNFLKYYTQVLELETYHRDNPQFFKNNVIFNFRYYLTSHHLKNQEEYQYLKQHKQFKKIEPSQQNMFQVLEFKTNFHF